MSNPVTQRTDTLEIWRQNLNTIGSNLGDPVNIYVSDGSDTFNHPATNIFVAAVNDLNNRKVKRSGDTITSLIVASTLQVDGATTVSTLSASGQITSTVSTGTAPFVVASTTPVSNLSIGGNAATSTTSSNLSGGALGSIPYQTAANNTSMLALGTANYFLSVNTAGNGLEYKQFTSTGGSISISYSAGKINLEASGTTGATSFTGDISTLNGSTITFDVAHTTGNTWIGGTLSLGGTFVGGVITGSTFNVATNGNVTVGASSLTITASNGNLTSSGTLSSVNLSVSTTATLPATSMTSATITGTTSFNSLTDIQTATLTTTSTTANQVIASVPTSTYRSVEYIIQGVDSTSLKYHSSTIKAVHDGTNVSFTEYASAATANGLTGSFNVAISGGNLQLQVTPSTSNSTVFKVYSILTRV